MLMPSIFGESLLDDFFGDRNGSARNNMRYPAPSNSIMKTDIKESENDYEINIDLPGYKKEDVQAELKDGYLVITAKNESSVEDTGSKEYIRRERFFGTCSRSFYVGKEVQQEDISARFENGVLIMNVPKHVEKPVEEKKYISIMG
ncbi:MAG: Hsp20/alpha crystallin family protein [Lachnospiraceae bacterium]|nr:Hsp20/alpha crystallin family protein [Lachnospiraceae bacterium]MCM1239617.1 Hsp20/alpha crystallin family protein [Lachnospiraceae bacterium]MCM1302733.1 Hsp20/alpha crystallin family protein [Butyrivibrio sp.]MCM1410241.1 Hsp20/alpha crystallin family protein [Lachnospiraceae bacterium]